MKIIAIIPARYKSSRFPGKPLAIINGKPLLIRVCERVEQVIEKDQVLVATDDERIANLASENGYQFVMTSENHLTGTDRIAEVAEKIEADIYINVQGDEPMINPTDINKVITLKKEYPNFIINCMAKLDENEDVTSLNIPKIVTNQEKELMYISRSVIPGSKESVCSTYFKQVCIYAFNREELLLIRKHPDKTPLEVFEDIEILRFMELGKKVKMLEVESGSLAVDIPEDVEKVEKALNAR